MLHFYRALALAAGLVVTSIGGAGMFSHYTESELVKNSDLIVVGTLIGRTRLKTDPDAGEFSVGVIAIDDIVKGNPGESIALLILPTPGAPIASDTISYDVGQQGLWFLRSQVGAQGLYVADHPQRFSPLDDLERVVALKKLVAGTD